ncbi:alpha/beta hydrolase [Cupriavidus sp. L7L]|nr:alpha/beta hydrolase [Cupriavidus sp. L7L]
MRRGAANRTGPTSARRQSRGRPCPARSGTSGARPRSLSRRARRGSARSGRRC